MNTVNSFKSNKTTETRNCAINQIFHEFKQKLTRTHITKPSISRLTLNNIDSLTIKQTESDQARYIYIYIVIAKSTLVVYREFHIKLAEKNP